MINNPEDPSYTIYIEAMLGPFWSDNREKTGKLPLTKDLLNGARLIVAHHSDGRKEVIKSHALPASTESLRYELAEAKKRIDELEAKLLKAQKMPFKLTEFENEAFMRWHGRQPHQHAQAECDAALLCMALSRACNPRNVEAASANEPLTLQEERLVQDFEGLTMAEQGNGFSLLPIIRKRSPRKQLPTKKTLGQICYEGRMESEENKYSKYVYPWESLDEEEKAENELGAAAVAAFLTEKKNHE